MLQNCTIFVFCGNMVGNYRKIKKSTPRFFVVFRTFFYYATRWMNDSIWFLFVSGFYVDWYIKPFIIEITHRVIKYRTTSRSQRQEDRSYWTKMARNLIESHEWVGKHGKNTRKITTMPTRENDWARIVENEKKKNRLFRRLSRFCGPLFQKWQRTGRKLDALFRMSPRT
jgi:hypothetical protein